MSIGASIFLIAVGAILYFAVDLGSVGPVEISAVGVILMIAGIIGLIISLFLLSRATPRDRGIR
ncbi:MAG: hypothetical protein AVDCRST_MAG17-606 [uncultured Solirubrobacterales bacterium]|uniref:DUF6458 domain-containing protein n=1 Tax=uncultured Solirubrobacterales bacterium TaxID=768556 RepID=A0A6J4S7B2_9ACTN|nr:MAG: hypothetical protein AVDCRST_MAG17-606 [uncultured Solirubrobacterales bacterium]